MNLEQALATEALNTPVKREDCPCEKTRISASQMAKQVFAMAEEKGTPFLHQTPQGWARKWLASPEFVLIDIPASAAAVPLTPKNPNQVLRNIRATADSKPPIVVDLNKRGIGSTPGGTFVPEVIVIDGKHRHTAAMMQGCGSVQAWVGVKALKYVLKGARTIEAASVPARQVVKARSVVSSEAVLYAGAVPAQDRATEDGSAPHMPMPGVKATGPAMKPFTKGQKPIAAAGAGGGTGGTGGTGGMGNMTSGPMPKVNAEDNVEQVKEFGDPLKAKGLKADASDTDSVVDPSDEGYPPDPSDKKAGMQYPLPQTSTGKCQCNDKPCKHTKGKNKFGNASKDAPGTGVGPQQKPNAGATRSDLQKVMGCNDKMKAGRIPGTIRTKKKKHLKAGGPGSGRKPENLSDDDRKWLGDWMNKRQPSSFEKRANESVSREAREESMRMGRSKK